MIQLDDHVGHEREPVGAVRAYEERGDAVAALRSAGTVASVAVQSTTIASGAVDAPASSPGAASPLPGSGFPPLPMAAEKSSCGARGGGGSGKRDEHGRMRVQSGALRLTLVRDAERNQR